MTDPSRIALLADDLTGALDSAAAFASGGTETFVSIEGSLDLASCRQVISVNADTRRMSVADATPAISKATERIAASGAQLRYVKIDSTLRGHPGLEISIAAQVSKARLVLITPAFPATGRVVLDGNLLVNGVPLAETEVGRDMLSAPTGSDVAATLQRDSKLNIWRIPLDTMRSGKLPNQLVRLAEDHPGQPVLVACDAETDDDLDALVKAGLTIESEHFKQPASVLFAGSAGLASALARSVQILANENVKNQIAAQPPFLIVTASQRSLADQQIEALVAAKLARRRRIRFRIDGGGGTSLYPFDDPVVQKTMANSSSVVLHGSVSSDLSELTPETLRAVADSITRELGQLVARLIAASAKPGALIIIGGDTAFAVLSAVEARGIVLAAEALPGVPVGIISGGALDGIPVATKAGAFGDEQTLVQLFKHLSKSSS